MICVRNVNEGACFIVDPISRESGRLIIFGRDTGRLLWRWLLPLYFSN